MALAVAGIGPGDEVIVPAISFVATATAVARVGAIPVFVDIEGDTFNIDPARAAEAVTPQSAALCAVHFGGPMADMEALRALSIREEVPLVEDAAHAQGSEWKGRRAGGFGGWGSFSFQNGKVLTAGEGGAVVTDSDELAEALRGFANQGRRKGEGFFHHYTIGSNLRMTAWQAAVLTGQLEKLDAQIAARRRNDALLRELTADVPGLRWQKVLEPARVHSHYLMLGRTPDRDALCERLKQAGVPCTPFYPHALYGNPVFVDGYPCVAHACPVAEACVRDAFWLPHRVLMASEETIREIARVIREALAG
jgi:dTDP-4-amino-4,6-dideoxygalactose transaminase